MQVRVPGGGFGLVVVEKEVFDQFGPGLARRSEDGIGRSSRHIGYMGLVGRNVEVARKIETAGTLKRSKAPESKQSEGCTLAVASSRNKYEYTSSSRRSSRHDGMTTMTERGLDQRRQMEPDRHVVHVVISDLDLLLLTCRYAIHHYTRPVALNFDWTSLRA